MTTRQAVIIGTLLIVGVTQSGCSSFNRKLKSLLNGGPVESSSTQKTSLTKFSDSGDLTPRVRREYKRTTKESLRDTSALEAKTGSLWVMEGQGAYLFSQNVIRMIGDPLAVALEGEPREQLNSKVSVIRKLLAKIEERQKARLRDPASGEGISGKDKKEKSAEKNPTNQAQNEQNKSKEETLGGDFSVKTVPTRIVERTVDGNYRVKGAQPFLIGSREYRVIVTGVVRAEDFSEDGIPASKLLDAKYDIVSARRKEESL